MSAILYPVARDQEGCAVHIDDWQRGHAVTCFGCGQDLVGRLPHDGIKPTAHFAHKVDAACSGETALHKAAKAAITRTHASGRLRALSWECPLCKRCRHETDLRAFVLHEEARPCVGVVSDVLGVDAVGEPRVAIEIVVTHDVAAETLERYRTNGIYVFVLRPSWGLVGDLVHGSDPLHVDLRVGFVDTASCAGCQQVVREKDEWAARERAQKEAAWWSAWISSWNAVGKEALMQKADQQRAALQMRTREYYWWTSWAHLWWRVADQIVVSWWIAWRQAWREIGVRHARPIQWWISWISLWGSIGTQHAVSVMESARRLAEDRRCERARRESWWPAWLRVWAEIGQRASGVMAAWRPICRTCRQDLTPDHQCLLRHAGGGAGRGTGSTS